MLIHSCSGNISWFLPYHRGLDILCQTVSSWTYAWNKEICENDMIQNAACCHIILERDHGVVFVRWHIKPSQTANTLGSMSICESVGSMSNRRRSEGLCYLGHGLYHSNHHAALSSKAWNTYGERSRGVSKDLVVVVCLWYCRFSWLSF